MRPPLLLYSTEVCRGRAGPAWANADQSLCLECHPSLSGNGTYMLEGACHKNPAVNNRKEDSTQCSNNQSINQCLNVSQNSRFRITQWNHIWQRWIQSINFVPQCCEPWVNYGIRSGENRSWSHIWVTPWRHSLTFLSKKLQTMKHACKKSRNLRLL